MMKFDEWLNEIASANASMPISFWHAWNNLRFSKDMYAISKNLDYITNYLNNLMSKVDFETKERIRMFLSGFPAQLYRGMSPDMWKEWDNELKFIMNKTT